MLSWLFANLATIVVALVLAVVVGAIVVRMVNNKKKGKSSCGCGCGCSGCAMKDACHTK